FEPVHDGAGRADEVVAHARAKQRGEIERIESDGGGHKNVSVAGRDGLRQAARDSKPPAHRARLYTAAAGNANRCCVPDRDLDPELLDALSSRASTAGQAIL